MNRRLMLPALALMSIAALSTTTSSAMENDVQGTVLKVTVTNLTRGQVLSPPVVAIHDDSFRLFSPGEAASDELAQLAEDAVAGPLLGMLSTTDGVLHARAGTAPIPPGGSDSVVIMARGRYRSVTVAGMLVTTNDAFYAATGRVAGRGAANTVLALAWDAGTEANTESCTDIPGPPCGHPLVRVTEGAEGHVFIHSGIYGGASLDPSMHDWRNPTALITIERLR